MFSVLPGKKKMFTLPRSITDSGKIRTGGAKASAEPFEKSSNSSSGHVENKTSDFQDSEGETKSSTKEGR